MYTILEREWKCTLREQKSSGSSPTKCFIMYVLRLYYNNDIICIYYVHYIMTSFWTSTKKVRTPKKLDCFYDGIIVLLLLTILYLFFDFIGTREVVVPQLIFHNYSYSYFLIVIHREIYILIVIQNYKIPSIIKHLCDNLKNI